MYDKIGTVLGLKYRNPSIIVYIISYYSYRDTISKDKVHKVQLYLQKKWLQFQQLLYNMRFYL